MMLEEAYAVAPGASLYFCGPETDVEYVGCLQALAADGVNIVSDDLTFLPEDMMSTESALATGVSGVLAANAGLSLFTVTGNYNGSYWQGAYNPTSSTAVSTTCPSTGQIDTEVQSFGGAQYAEITVAEAASGIPLVFQWGDPFDQPTSNFDLYFIDMQLGEGVCIPLAGSTEAEFGATLDALENLITPTTSIPAGNYAVIIGTPDSSLSGKYLKLLVAGDGLTTLADSTSGSITSPQEFLSNVNTVGAVGAVDTANGASSLGDTLEPFSGVGPLTLLFPSQSTQQAPLVVAPDGIYVDATGTYFSSYTASGSLFYGTSAASPNAASVAALLLSAFPSLTPAELTNALEMGATMLGSGSPDPSYGYGRVSAVGALGAIAAPTVSGFTSASVVGGSSSAPLSFNVSGTGALSVQVTPASLIPASSSGVQISPASCGSTDPASCSVVLTPTLGASGSTTVTLKVTDGAHRSAAYQASVTVSKPAPPTISITAGGSQTVDPSATLAPITLTVAGTGPLTVSAAFHSSVVLTPGCGSTVMTCTATSTAPSSSGVSSIVFTVKDSWSQTSTASASITVPSPKSGGGGSMDLALIVALATVLALKLRRASLQ